jgi:hypothetical protein
MPPQIPEERITVEQNDQRPVAFLDVVQANAVHGSKAMIKALRVIDAIHFAISPTEFFAKDSRSKQMEQTTHQDDDGDVAKRVGRSTRVELSTKVCRE